MKYGHFDETGYAITRPDTPRPWINYLGNGRLRAFISQNAGGLLWYLEPYTRRITRYHYTAAPADRPGFYVYIKDRESRKIWNPHFAPTCTPLDSFSAHHRPGITAFTATCDGIEAVLRYTITPVDNCMVWDLTLRNTGSRPRALLTASYMEFGLLEFMREVIGWCYLKGHFSLRFDVVKNAILYDYHVFEAPATPAMAFGCTEAVSGWECSRDAFVGRTGSLESPRGLIDGLSNSDLPLGGHACSTLGVSVDLAPGESRSLGYTFALGDDWATVEECLRRYRDRSVISAAFDAVDANWRRSLSTLSIESASPLFNAYVNTWNPYNSVVALETARSISTDHMGTDALRFRDTCQDALAVVHIRPEMAAEYMRLILAQQTSDGGGCMSFFPHTSRPTSDLPHRSDNPVWLIYTTEAMAAESGCDSFYEEVIPWRDGGGETVYEHVRIGLRHIAERRGPHGLPTLFHADWNDGLALFEDEEAESIMLAQQLVYSLRLFQGVAGRKGRPEDIEWAEALCTELEKILTSEVCWDGRWFRRLILSDGTAIGSDARAQGKIYLNPQSWSVLAGLDRKKALQSMASAKEHLDCEFGPAILHPPYRGFPEPTDPPKGSNPGVNENGAVFCHASTWAVIAECLLGHAEEAWHYYYSIIPENVASRVGYDHYQREPYVYASSIVGPASDRKGAGGISWLTGTSSWSYIAATQYLLGVRPTFAGLLLEPCLPVSCGEITLTRLFRGTTYRIRLINKGYRCKGVEAIQVSVGGMKLAGRCLVPPSEPARDPVDVECWY